MSESMRYDSPAEAYKRCDFVNDVLRLLRKYDPERYGNIPEAASIVAFRQAVLSCGPYVLCDWGMSLTALLPEIKGFVDGKGPNNSVMDRATFLRMAEDKYRADTTLAAEMADAQDFEPSFTEDCELGER